jgi:chaperonin GroEL
MVCLTMLPVPPPQVVRTALVDAASVSSLITTSECVIVDAPQDKQPAAAAPGAGYGDMY